MRARFLHTPDRPVVEAFLERHAESSMILRGNLRDAGIEDDGSRYAGTYAGAFDEHGELRAVVAHYTHGNIFLQADDLAALESATRCSVVEGSDRAVLGIIGTRKLVVHARDVLGLNDVPARFDSDEGLYALDLTRLQLPPLASEPEIELRAITADDVELMVGWRKMYEMEGLGSKDDEKLDAHCRAMIELWLAQGFPILLTHRGAPCAMTMFNARLPDMRQIGGVFTPSELRGRGYARTAVALSLIGARDEGVKRAILFTGEDNVAAIAAYRALGFERVGDFKLLLLA
jgi:RimJ/RimL family protein N-acetyltransferase